MSDCNRNPLEFSSHGSKSVVADFKGGRLTTDGGAILLSEVALRTGLFEELDEVIPDPRNPIYTVHEQKTMLGQLIIAPEHRHPEIDRPRTSPQNIDTQKLTDFRPRTQTPRNRPISDFLHFE